MSVSENALRGNFTAKPGHRFYSPSLGRFINKDPIEEQGGLNLYGFCGNNGVNRYDMLGQYEVDYGEDGTITFRVNHYTDAGDDWVSYTGRGQEWLDYMIQQGQGGAAGYEEFETITAPRGIAAIMGGSGFDNSSSSNVYQGVDFLMQSDMITGNIVYPADYNGAGNARVNHNLTPTVTIPDFQEIPDDAPTALAPYVSSSHLPSTVMPASAYAAGYDNHNRHTPNSYDLYRSLDFRGLDGAPMAMVRGGAVITGGVAVGFAAPVVTGAVVTFFRPIAAATVLAAGSPAGQHVITETMDFLDQAVPGPPGPFNSVGGALGLISTIYEDAWDGYEAVLNGAKPLPPNPPPRK